MKHYLMLALAVAAAGCDRPTAPPALAPGSALEQLGDTPASCPASDDFSIRLIAPPGTATSRGVAINERGEVVVTSDAGNFLWSATGGFVRIPMDHPRGVNGAGVVVGWNGSEFGLDRQAILWSPETGAEELPAPPGYGSTFARGINEAGMVVGGARGPTPPTPPGSEAPEETWAPLYWNGSGVPTLLPLGDLSYFFELAGAVGLNERGDVIGEGLAESYGFILLWRSAEAGGPPTPLVPPMGDGGFPTDINNDVRISGTSHIDPGGQHEGFVWSEALGFQNLSPSNDISRANGINDEGTVVGFLARALALLDWADPVPVRWTAEGTVDQLPLFADSRTGEALAINEAGEIVGVLDGQAVLWKREQPVSLDDVRQRLQLLVGSGTLAAGAARSLMASLDVATRQGELGNADAARGALGAFLNKLNALVRRGEIAVTEADWLRDAATCIRAQL